MRIIVVGKEGQVARALAERARAHGAQAVLVGRPKLDLADPSGIEDALIDTGGDVIVNAAAYTAVDQAGPIPSSPTRSMGSARAPLPALRPR